MYHLNFYFSLSMGKTTELFIFTFIRFIRITFAEFGFIAYWMINLFNFIVRINTIAIFTMLFRAQLITVLSKIRPSSIHLCMIIYTSFSFMIFQNKASSTFPGTWFSFVRIYIESKKLTILKSLLIFAMKMWTNNTMLAIVEIHAPMSFIN